MSPLALRKNLALHYGPSDPTNDVPALSSDFISYVPSARSFQHIC